MLLGLVSYEAIFLGLQMCVHMVISLCMHLVSLSESPLFFFLASPHFLQSTSKRNAGLEEAQAGIKIAGRNINNLRYPDDTNLMAESEEELKSLLMKVKVESEKVGLKLNI